MMSMLSRDFALLRAEKRAMAMTSFHALVLELWQAAACNGQSLTFRKFLYFDDLDRWRLESRVTHQLLQLLSSPVAATNKRARS